MAKNCKATKGAHAGTWAPWTEGGPDLARTIWRKRCACGKVLAWGPAGSRS